MAKHFDETVDASDQRSMINPDVGSKRRRVLEIRASYRILGEIAIALLDIEDATVRNQLAGVNIDVSRHLTEWRDPS